MAAPFNNDNHLIYNNKVMTDILNNAQKTIKK